MERERVAGAEGILMRVGSISIEENKFDNFGLRRVGMSKLGSLITTIGAYTWDC